MNPTCDLLSKKVSEAAKILIGIPVFSSIENAEDYIWTRLGNLGIYRDEESYNLLLSPECTEGDARCVFCENGEPNLPVVRFKKMWTTLKCHTVSNEEQDKLRDVISILKPIGQWTDAELMAKYAPDCSDEIVFELNKRSNGRAFVLFKDEVKGIVDIDASLRLLKEARKRETPIHYKMGDFLKKLHIAGDFLTSFHYECPLHKGLLLFDGYCDECGHTWECVDSSVRQFVRVIVDNGEAPESGPSVRQLIATARQCSNDDFDALAMDYPKSHVVFKKLELDDRLPNLKSRTATLNNRVSDLLCVLKRF